MGTMQPAWPVKQRELHNHHMDSTVWNDFRFRDDDIVIATYAKSGTTWTQQIVANLLFAGQEALPVARLSPWLDLRVLPRAETLAALEAQTHRRFLKTHLPVDALVYAPQAKYLYIGRDGRDVVWSLYNHHARATPVWYALLNDTPGRVGPPIAPPDPDLRAYFLAWLERDGFPFWSFWDNLRSWWRIRDLPNLLFLHYADMKADLPGQVRRIADFLGIAVDEARWPAILEHCSFDYMKRHGRLAVPGEGVFWEGGAGTFVHRGVNDRWRDTLTYGDCMAYMGRALSNLGFDCARWLAEGGPAT